MSGHTPGPWIHNPRARDGHVDAISNGHTCFIQVGCPHVERPILDYPHENEQTANARLVAAAPDLLAACHDALLALVSLTSDPQHDEEAARDCAETALATLEAAIAKAEGGAE